MQTKLKVEFNSEGLCQDQGGCYWPVKKAGKGGMALNSMTLTQKLSNFSCWKNETFQKCTCINIFLFETRTDLFLGM